MPEPSDNMLIQQYANGSLAAFEQLYTRHKGGIYRYLLRQVHNQTLAEDICQEVWGKVISNAKAYVENIKSGAQAHLTTSNTKEDSAKKHSIVESSFKAWLYTIARNKLIDHVRHVKVVQQVMVNDEISELDKVEQATQAQQKSGINTPEAMAQQHVQALAITHCIKQLPRHQLDCFLLKEEAGLTVKTISDITQTSVEASKSRLKTAYKNLRACLDIKLDWLTQEAKNG